MSSLVLTLLWRKFLPTDFQYGFELEALASPSDVTFDEDFISVDTAEVGSILAAAGQVEVKRAIISVQVSCLLHAIVAFSDRSQCPCLDLPLQQLLAACDSGVL